MQEWVEFLNGFLDLSRFPILKDKGKVNALKAKKAEREYEVYRLRRDTEYLSDFDREVARITGKSRDT